MDHFKSLRSIYSSIFDKEVLDKKTLFGDNLYRRIRGWYLALPLGPWEGPRANQMDQFISLRSIYSSISNKESLDKKDTFLGQPVLAHPRLVSGPSTWTLGRPYG